MANDTKKKKCSNRHKHRLFIAVDCPVPVIDEKPLSKGPEAKQSEQDDCEQIEISPYIKSVMEGAPPRYLDDEIEAINLAKKLGWRPKLGGGSPAYRPGSYMEYLHNHPEEVDRILREHGIDPYEINKTLEQGGGILPGWNGKKNKRN